MYFLC